MAIDPEIGANNFAGGAQDNGTQFRDKTGILGVAASDSNNHRRVIGGDGGIRWYFKNEMVVIQYLYGYSSIRQFETWTITSHLLMRVEIRPNGLTASRINNRIWRVCYQF